MDSILHLFKWITFDKKFLVFEHISSYPCRKECKKSSIIMTLNFQEYSFSEQ